MRFHLFTTAALVLCPAMPSPAMAGVVLLLTLAIPPVLFLPWKSTPVEAMPAGRRARGLRSRIGCGPKSVFGCSAPWGVAAGPEDRLSGLMRMAGGGSAPVALRFRRAFG
jgi:hypothetical protein